MSQFGTANTRRSTLALFVAILLSIATSIEAADPPAQTKKEAPKNSVYIKILIPKKEPAPDQHAPVETWIKEALEKQRARPELRAVTDWVLLPGQEEKEASLWMAVLDGEQWGCPVHGKVKNWTDDGKVNVSLDGWAPIVPDIVGTTLPAEVGSRGMAEVFYGTDHEAFVAILVGPPQTKTDAAKKADE